MGELPFALALGFVELVAKTAVVGQWLELAQVTEVRDPAVTNRRGDRLGERRVRQQQPASGRDAVRLVAEAIGIHLGQILHGDRAQQFGVDRGYSVGAVRADDGQVRHADMLGWSFFDQADPGDAVFVAREADSDGVEQATVDFEDDLQMARQQHLEPRDRPFLQRFWQKGVIRVCQGPLRQVPGLVPPQVRFVQKNAHQLRYRHAGVRVVELNGDFLGKGMPVGIAATEPPHQVGQRTGDQKILLNEAQFLPPGRRVVGIEHPSEGFGRERSGQCTDEIAAAESLKVEIIGRGGSPQPKCVDGLAAVAHYRAIEGDTDQTRLLADDGRNAPSCPSTEQFSLISTRSCGRTISQGSGRRSQLSGCSCCHPFWMVCRKMPYS